MFYIVAVNRTVDTTVESD